MEWYHSYLTCHSAFLDKFLSKPLDAEASVYNNAERASSIHGPITPIRSLNAEVISTASALVCIVSG